MFTKRHVFIIAISIILGMVVWLAHTCVSTYRDCKTQTAVIQQSLDSLQKLNEYKDICMDISYEMIDGI